MHPVQLLAVVPARLFVAVRPAVTELRARGVVFHPLDDSPVRIAVGLDHCPTGQKGLNNNLFHRSVSFIIVWLRVLFLIEIGSKDINSPR